MIQMSQSRQKKKKQPCDNLLLPVVFYGEHADFYELLGLYNLSFQSDLSVSSIVTILWFPNSSLVGSNLALFFFSVINLCMISESLIRNYSHLGGPSKEKIQQLQMRKLNGLHNISHSYFLSEPDPPRIVSASGCLVSFTSSNLRHSQAHGTSAW